MVKKVGFICEGETEKIIVESASFLQLLANLKLQFVKAVDAAGNGNLLPKNIENHLITMKRYEADYVIILTDLDEDICITKTKERIKDNLPENAIIIISVKAIESWFLADSVTLSTIFKRNFLFEFPEKVNQKPIDVINQLFQENLNRGIGKDKPKLAKFMLKNGFDLNNAVKHANCPSALYFLNKLKQIAHA